MGKKTVGAGGPKQGERVPRGHRACAAPQSGTGAGRDPEVTGLPAPRPAPCSPPVLRAFSITGASSERDQMEALSHPQGRGGVRPRAPG